MLSSLLCDLRYGARRLGGTPGFTGAAVLTIALGVGLNTGVFSVLNGIFLSDLPVPAADELVDIYATVAGVDGRNEKGQVNPRLTTSEYELFRDGSETLHGLLGYSLAWPIVLGGEVTREIMGRYVTCNYFDVLRQPPAIGRALTSSDCQPGATPVVVLSYDFWRNAFGTDPAIVGRTIALNGRPITVAGIAAADAYQPGMQKLDVFAPIAAQPVLRPDREWLASEDFGWLTLIGRRNGESTIGQVRAELAVIAAELDRRLRGRTTTVHVDRASVATNQPVGGINLVLNVVSVLVPFGLVLLAACANVATLFLARVTTRAPEIALRLSLGAGRARVVRQLLIEVLLVAILGGALGLLLSFRAFEVAAAAALSSLSIALPALELDISVLSFAFTLSLAAGLLAGLGPALRASNADLNTAMKQVGRGDSRPADGRLQGALIGVQVGVSVVLVIAAGLLLRGLYSANQIDPGFPYRDIAVVTGDLRDLGYVDEELISFQRTLADAVRALPGVAAAGYSTDPPWFERESNRMIRLPDRSDAPYLRAERSHVSEGYFAAIGVPIVRGRDFTADELAETSTAVIVAESTAERLWPGQDPLERTLLARVGQTDQPLRVVGVVRDAEVSRIGEIDTDHIYQPPQRDYRHMLSLVVRSNGDAAAVAIELRGLLSRFGLALNVSPLEANLAVWRELSALLSGVAVALGALTLALASIGIFGVVSYVVNRRLREIGIRLALGARKREVLRVILTRTLRPVVIGAVLGGISAVVVSDVLSSVLFGVSPVDPIGIGCALVFVLGVAFLASVMPARRGLRIDPMETLRNE